MSGGLTVYRHCGCGETAHDYTGRSSSDGRLIYACRNCGKERVPNDARSKKLARKPLTADTRIEDALLDMPDNDPQRLVPPLQMAAHAAGVKLKKLAPLFYGVEGTGYSYAVTISVGEHHYEARRGPIGRGRWKTLGKWRRAARVIREVKEWTT